MSLSPTSRQVILQEVFDEASVPTDEEIYDYALRIGIDVDREPHLLYLARDGLMQALPPGWKPCYDKDKKEIYYFNFKTKKAQWEHPLDDVYRNLVKKTRNESATCSDQIDDDSRTSLKEDLKSYEEASSLILPSNEMYPKLKKLEPLSPIEKGALKKIPPSLSPLKKSNSKDFLKSNPTFKSSLHIDEEKFLQKSENEDSPKKLTYDETEVRKRPNSSDIRNRRNIGPVEFRHLSKQEIIAPNALEKLNFLSETKKLVESKLSESPSIENRGSDYGVATKDEGYGTEFSVSSLGERDFAGKKELTLSGGGSVFLKNNKMKSSPSSDLATSSFSKEELSDGLLSPEVRKSGSEIDSHPKGILRDQKGEKLAEKVTPNLGERKFRKEEADDERKSVRFNLEKELKITFEIPQATSSESEENTTSRKSIPTKGNQEETRQIEVDFDDLEIDIIEEKVADVKVEEEEEEKKKKTVFEPKKFKPSQSLVREFREIFENQSKTRLNLMGLGKVEEKQNSGKSSRSSSSRSTTSQEEKSSSHEDSKISIVDNLIDLDESKGGESSQKSSGKSKTDVLENLVDFALKKKFGLETKEENVSKRKIFYQEKDCLLDDILKGNESESSGESEDEKVFIPEDKELEYLEKLECEINEKALERKEMEENYEKMKKEKIREMERNQRKLVEDLEKSFEEKKEETMRNLEEKYGKWMKEKEEESKKIHEEESRKRLDKLKEEFLVREEEEVEKMKSQLELEQKERLKKLREEIEDKEKTELENLKKSFEENLNEKKVELMKKHKEEIEKIEKNLEDLLSEQKAQKLKELELARENEAVIEVMRLEMKESYQKQKNNLMKEHELLLENLRQEHALAVEQLKIELKNEEEFLRKAHMNRLDEIKMRIEATEGRKSENLETPRSDNTEARVFEKVRCEKRLLEDKYKTLKEKYIRLKTEAKSTLERKKKNKEASAATGSETEKSSSCKGYGGKNDYDSPNARRKLEADKKIKLKKQINNLDYLYQNVSTEDEENLMSPKNLPIYQKSSEVKPVEMSKKQAKNEEKSLKFAAESEKSKEESSGEEKRGEKNETTTTKKKRQLFSRFKAASTSRINSNNRNQGKEMLSPVENLRRQLKKLEELEDQFPVTTHTDTYMRYPFTDNPQFGSSEIEFFKHRIHLERESVRRAKGSLKAQKKSFENRQKELKQKLVEGDPGTKSVIDQIYQEEKELTDMEVSVHRTRALLGEKIIRLRHLEQSLKRISQPLKKESFSVKSKDLLGRLGVRNQAKDEDRTLSDLSSYSGSSGFSSTDFNDTHNAIVGGKKNSSLDQNRRHFENNMQESSEIIQSLENLNSEIREIWEVLKKQHQSGQETITMLPPPPLIYGDLGWPAFTLSPPLPFRNTVITSTSNLQRPIAQQYKTQVTSASNLGHVSTVIDSTLIDRTRSLRDWLKAARSTTTPSDVISPSQKNPYILSMKKSSKSYNSATIAVTTALPVPEISALENSPAACRLRKPEALERRRSVVSIGGPGGRRATCPEFLQRAPFRRYGPLKFRTTARPPSETDSVSFNLIAAFGGGPRGLQNATFAVAAALPVSAESRPERNHDVSLEPTALQRPFPSRPAEDPERSRT